MLQPGDLLQPTGLIDPAIVFPGVPLEDVNSTIQAYLDLAYSQLAAKGIDAGVWDAAATAYVYARVFQRTYMQISSKPQSASLNDQGSITYDRSQYTTYLSWYEKYWAEWLSYFGTQSPSATAGQSLHTATTITW